MVRVPTNQLATHLKMNKMFSNIVLLLLLGFIWGSGYVIANYCVRHGTPPLGYAFWQSVGPAIALILISVLRRKPHIHFKKKYLSYYFVCGLLGIALPNSLIYFTSQHLPAGIVGVMANIVPLVIYPLALIAKQEVFSWQRCLAVLVGVTGVMLVIFQHTHIQTQSGTPWIFIILLTPLCFAFCSVFIAHARPIPSDSLGLSNGMLFVSSCLLSPVVFLTHSFYRFAIPLTTTDWLILLEILLSTVGYVIFFLLIKRAGPVFYSLVSGTVALTSLFWSWLIFHSIPSFLTGCAVGLIVIAIGILAKQP